MALPIRSWGQQLLLPALWTRTCTRPVALRTTPPPPPPPAPQLGNFPRCRSDLREARLRNQKREQLAKQLKATPGSPEGEAAVEEALARWTAKREDDCKRREKKQAQKRAQKKSRPMRGKKLRLGEGGWSDGVSDLRQEMLRVGEDGNRGKAGGEGGS